jgi:spermidine synthase
MKIRDLISSFWGIRVKKVVSPINGILEVWYISGKYQLDSDNSNYSFGSLHRLFQQVFVKVGLKERNPENLLLLGFGAGSVVSIIRDELKMLTKITGVENDELVIQLAKEYFGIDRFSGLTVIHDDAAGFMATDGQRFDCVVIDLFHDQEVPEKFIQYSFLKNCFQHLSERGKLIFNFIVLTKKQKKRFEELKMIIQSLGREFRVVDVFGTNKVIIVG